MKHTAPRCRSKDVTYLCVSSMDLHEYFCMILYVMLCILYGSSLPTAMNASTHAPLFQQQLQQQSTQNKCTKWQMSHSPKKLKSSMTREV